MPKHLFKLKEFDVLHAQSSMKVGTDALVLGATTSISFTPDNILDIGTGCGILALMMAQKYPKSKIVAIDIHQESIQEAELNFNNSKFVSIESLHCSVQNLAATTTNKFDLIVSNPPFFEKDLKSEVEARNFARHNEHLSFEELFQAAYDLLTNKGLFWFILPYRYESKLDALIQTKKLHILRKIYIGNDTKDEVVRIIYCVSKLQELCEISSMNIRINGAYSLEYIELTKNFHSADLSVSK